METNKQWKRVPFDIELAKKIQSGEIEGRIVTESGIPVRIICFDRINDHHKPIVAMGKYQYNEEIYTFSKNGEYDWGANPQFNLTIELPEETPKQEFKVGDKVIIHPNRTHSEFVKGYCNQIGYITNIKGDKIYVIVIGAFQDCFFPDELELVKKQAEHEFKPFDKVLVRDSISRRRWTPRLYAYTIDGIIWCQDGINYDEILPYEGNEHLVGTTDNPE